MSELLGTFEIYQFQKVWLHFEFVSTTAEDAYGSSNIRAQQFIFCLTYTHWRIQGGGANRAMPPPQKLFGLAPFATRRLSVIRRRRRRMTERRCDRSVTRRRKRRVAEGASNDTIHFNKHVPTCLPHPGAAAMPTDMPLPWFMPALSVQANRRLLSWHPAPSVQANRRPLF